VKVVPANSNSPVALVTGAAQRLGAEICRSLHARGYRIIIHYRYSVEPAEGLRDELNAQRPDSAVIFSANMNSLPEVRALADAALLQWQRVDVLVNNASGFYPTAIESATRE
jgi:pteridine reductase